MKANDLVIEWTSGNFKEILPDNLSPYSESVLPGLFNAAFEKLYSSYGCELRPEQKRMVDVFEKKAYFNITALYSLAEEFWGVEGRKVIEAMGGSVSNQLDRQTSVRPSASKKFGRYLRAMLVALKAVYNVRRFKPVAPKNDDPLTRLDRAERLLSEQLVHHLAIGLFSTSLIDMLVVAIGKSRNSQPSRDIHTLLRASDTAPSIRQQKAWNALIDAYMAKTGDNTKLFEDRFAAYLAEFGNRCVYEMEVAMPRLKENPCRILQELELLAKAIRRHESGDPRQASGDTGLQSPAGLIRRCGLMFPFLYILAAVARRMITEREMSKAAIAATAAQLRFILLEVSQSMNLEGIGCEQDIFFLKSQEIKYIHAHALGTARVQVHARKRQSAPMQANNLLERNGALIKPTPTPPLVGNVALSGLPVSSGVAKGYVRILENVNDVSELKKGEIAVVRALDAGWSLLFSVAGGIITEIGGMVSHAAILVREQNIPAIFNVDNLYQHLENGDFVELNCSTGTITKIVPEPAANTQAETDLARRN